jgi:hypothetical protein
MGMQVWVAGAGVAVGERGGDQPGDVDLAYPPVPSRVSSARSSTNRNAAATAA